MTKSRLLTDAELAARARRSRRTFVREIFYAFTKRKADENLVLRDWLRSQLHNMFFNGKSKQNAFKNIEFNLIEGGFFVPVKQDSTDITVEDLKLAITENLPHANPLIHSYIAKYAHQDGFLFSSSAATMEKLALNNKHMILGRKDLHFIDNLDGTVLYIEKFSIDGFTTFHDQEQTTIKKAAPLAMVVSISIIKVNPNATEVLSEKPDTSLNAVISHDLISDNILFLDTAAAQLFQEKDGHISRFYGNTAEEVDAEFLQAVNNYVDKRKRAIKPIVEFSEITEKTATSESTTTSLNSSQVTQLQVAAEPTLKTTSRMDHFFENQSPLFKETISQPEPAVANEPFGMERVSPPPQPKPTAKRLSDWQFIRNTTIGFALSGLAIGLSIGIAGGVFAAVPTLGLGLLAIPAFAFGGLVLGAFIGFTGSALGCGLAKLTEKSSTKKTVAIANEERKEQSITVDNSMYKTLQVGQSPSIHTKQSAAVTATTSKPMPISKPPASAPEPSPTTPTLRK